jgi:two-component sensor histidine kinase
MFGVEQLLLVEEITHRVINEYAVAITWINLAAETIVAPDAQAILRRTESRLRALVNAHRALQAPAIGLDLDLGNYLERLCAALAAASLRPARVQLFLHEESIILTPHRCWRVGLIIAELVTNSMRHGSVGAPQSPSTSGWRAMTCDVRSPIGVETAPTPALREDAESSSGWPGIWAARPGGASARTA